MSLIQTWIEPDRVRVAVDTIGNGTGTLATSGKREMTKLIPLAHAGVVLAFRGTDVMFLRVFAQVFLGSHNENFDAIVESMADRVSFAHKQWIPDCGVSAAGEIVVAGYSQKWIDMAATGFLVDLAADSTRQVDLPPPGFAAPKLPSIPNLSTDAGMVELAARQVQWMADNAPDEITGGRLLVADVRRDSITLRDLGDIPGTPHSRT